MITPSKTFTKQEAYDTMCAHLAKQKRRCINEDGTCVYRDGYGNKCVAGALVQDADYSDAMEIGTVTTVSNNGIYAFEALITDMEQNDTLEFLRAMQNVHDKAYNLVVIPNDTDGLPESVREKLARTATLYNITPGAEQAITEWNG